MTLQQAHELQRRELISLRAKVARLEKQTTGLFPVEEKETLERRIRHLEQLNKTENRRHEEARAHWKLMESLKFDLELENLELKEQLETALAENKLLRQRAEKAEAEVAMLNGTNAKLQKKLNTNFENSSLPSSALPFRKKYPTAASLPAKSPVLRKGTKPILHLSFLPLRNLLLFLLQMHLLLIRIYILQEKRLPNSLLISPYL